VFNNAGWLFRMEAQTNCSGLSLITGLRLCTVGPMMLMGQSDETASATRRYC
jgi:hypothetical protein